MWFYLLFVFFFIILSSATVSLSYEPRNHEVEALISIRKELNDPHGVLNNWDEDSVDPCSWAMITCSSENLVIGLGAPSQSLSGTLSGTIGNLTNLLQVLLQNNNISGNIPPELGSLQKLQTFDLSNNRFSGEIPGSFGQLNSLQYLLNNNSLSGPFPASLAKIPQLAFLDFSYNNLSGPVPKSPARTFNIVGNPLICGSSSTEVCLGSVDAAPLSFSLGSSNGEQKSKRLAIALGISLSFASLMLLTFALLWHRKKRKRLTILNISDKQEEGIISFGNLRNFTFRELQLATGNFSSKNILGTGGFGNVYKGKLGDGTLVAVKRLKDLTGSFGESQFMTELEMISLAVHRNLLRLVGYCATSNERLLVYPYMSNGSVASRLRGKPGLDWNTRKRIAIGAARGILYLHEQCDPKIIHRDVKAANVLLDDYCEAIVGDFGLAKLLDHADSHVTTAVRGTVGHIAPEYLSTGQSSEKTDVFGFGILLIELITGMRALEFGKTVSEENTSRKESEVLVDRELGNNYDRIEVGEMLHVALLSTQYLPAHRPKMSEVVRMLEGDGLAEKWAASHNHSNPTLIHFPNSFGNKSMPPPTTVSKHDGKSYDDESGNMLGTGMDDDDDEHSLDSYAMELSGPRERIVNGLLSLSVRWGMLLQCHACACCWLFVSFTRFGPSKLNPLSLKCPSLVLFFRDVMSFAEGPGGFSKFLPRGATTFIMAIHSSAYPILCASFNQDNSGFAISTKDGFKIIDSSTGRLCYERVNCTDVYELLLLQPSLSPRRLCLFNTTTSTPLPEMTFLTSILAVRLNRKR
ncbi:Protein NSP-INTERACTING KINASE 3 [Hibiscus syriacus]|uniref:non-specific serine/threonine protein kinase n=1 Tax=Hibiscus syriacus TaxID=106335 RepID=A0A6A3CUH2_HIBSY|nr:Protein NSP-INTERACTING KINASE 3 [Hibiscus syriacus]